MKHPRNILFVVEERDIDQAAAVSRAMALAESTQGELKFLAVLEQPRLGPFGGTVGLRDLETRMLELERARLQRLLQPHSDRPGVEVEVRFGRPFVEAIKDVVAHGRDLVIKATGDGGVHDFLFGGTDQHLLRRCPCPVWLLHHETRVRYERVVAAVDLDPWGESGDDGSLNDEILDWAASIAISDGAELHVAHAWESITDSMIRVFSSALTEEQQAANLEQEVDAYRDQLASLTDRLRRRIGGDAYGYVSPRVHLRQGNPRRVVPEVVSELGADLIVMGTLSRSGIPGFLIGNKAEVILNNVSCSVLTIKPQGFSAPVLETGGT